MNSFVQSLQRYDALQALKPVDVFMRLSHPQDWVWLDHALAAPDSTTWSYLCCAPQRRVEIHTAHTFITERGGSKQLLPVGGMEALEHVLKSSFSAKNDADKSKKNSFDGPPFLGGWAGYLGYSLAEEKPHIPENEELFPKAIISFFDSVLAYNHLEKSWWAVTQASSTVAACDNFDSLLVQLVNDISPIPVISHNKKRALKISTCQSNFSRKEFENRVHNALDWISAGDIYQVNLAQRLRAQWLGEEAELYQRLRSESPAEFGAFLPSGILGEGRALLSISPELFLRVRGREVTTRPIKGTRPRATTQALTDQASKELEQSPKERAELNMIVDLERNDLGRVCEYGSVIVQNPGEIQTLPTLLHRVATVSGRLRPDVGPAELLRATFPGGSITGAPKIRAMQIIDELETVPRGPYCGAIGWIGVNGDMDLSIAIRTAVLDRNKQQVDYHAGSGIVAGSDPASEYDETLHKSRAFLRAINASLTDLTDG